MSDRSFNPIHEYDGVYRLKFQQLIQRTFSEIAAESQVDLASNRNTCSQIYEMDGSLKLTEKYIKRWKWLRAILWLIVIFNCFAVLTHLKTIIPSFLVGYSAVTVVSLIVIFAKIRPSIKRLGNDKDKQSATIDGLKNTAWEQMKPLNRLFDWNLIPELISQTIPQIKFDPYFFSERADDLSKYYGWEGVTDNENSSILYCLSGQVNDNPFVLYRAREVNMIPKKFTGHRNIEYVTTTIIRTDSRGNRSYDNVKKAETLYASYMAPCPVYSEKTVLVYGSDAAPELSFKREKSKLKPKKLSKADFDRLFEKVEYSSKDQFDTLFTSAAKNRMVELIRNTEVAYGDDFSIEKKQRITTLISDHLQGERLDMDPAEYQNYDYEKIKKDFCEVNESHFKAIYFALAPLFCIPEYQRSNPVDIPSVDKDSRCSSYELDALANYIAKDTTKHPDIVTDRIIKAKMLDDSTVQLSITGYKVEERHMISSALAGNGRLYDVPVKWDAYEPVVTFMTFKIKEDNTFDGGFASYSQRADHIENQLLSSSAKFYRRNILLQEQTIS